MHRASRWHRLAARLALVACLIAAIVPGPGLVICMPLEPGGAIEIGLGADCPCGVDHPGDQPHCTDVAIDGLRDRSPAPVPMPDHGASVWLDLALAMPLPDVVPVVERLTPFPTGDPPAPRRALAERRSVVLLV